MIDDNDTDDCPCGGAFEARNDFTVICTDCHTIKLCDRSAELRTLRDCGVIRAPDDGLRWYRLCVYGDAYAVERLNGMADYRLMD